MFMKCTRLGIPRIRLEEDLGILDFNGLLTKRAGIATGTKYPCSLMLRYRRMHRQSLLHLALLSVLESAYQRVS